MKTLILMRHAKAEVIELGQHDFDRKLAEKGKKDAHSVSKLLEKQIPVIDLLITSAAKRTHKTAKIVAESYSNQFQLEMLHELYEAGADEYLKVIRNIDDTNNTVIIVGHNPTIGNLSNILSGNEIVNFKPGSIAAFQLDIETWKLFRLQKTNCIVDIKP